MVDHNDRKPDPYHEGYLCTSFDGEENIWYWAQLRGNTLFFYNGASNGQNFIDIDLEGRTVVETVTGVHPQFQLNTPLQSYLFGVDNMEQLLLWQAIIYAVSQMLIPQHLGLLPGQLIWLQDVIDKERKRRLLIQNPPDLLDFSTFSPVEQPLSTNEPNTNTYLSTDELKYPECFYDVMREEAERRLQSKMSGTFLLRPTGDGEHVCMSVKRSQYSPVQHYKILHTAKGYLLHNSGSDLFVQTLQEIVNHFEQHLGSGVRPYLENVTNTYEAPEYDSIGQLRSDPARRPRSSSEHAPPPRLPKPPLPSNASGHEKRPSRYPNVIIRVPEITLPALTTRLNNVIDELKLHVVKSKK
uniref:signal-transducing adaptor protein 1-like n=1 Tax=Myxine glutinosa TaxID=7769 RepID=UPI00358F474D